MAPNASAIVRGTFDPARHDLTTKIGCGRFTEDAAHACWLTDSHWGHLKKPNSLGGANHWNHHAVDNVCWRVDQPGQTHAIDIVQAGESSAAQVTWNPDQPRYQPSDWFPAERPDSFVLPPHTCGLGASLFFFFGAWRRHRYGEIGYQDRIDRNCDAIVADLTGTYVRDFLTVGGAVDPRTGQDPWGLIGTFYRWADWADTIESGLEYLFTKFGLLHAPTLVGEGAQFAHEDQILEMVERACGIFRRHREKLLFVEMWNERGVTGGNDQIVRRMGERFWQRCPEIPFALDTPAYAMGGLPEGNLQPLWDEMQRLYGGTHASVCTPQWNRSEPNPLDLGPLVQSMNLRLVDHESRGPDASAGGNVHHPVALMHDYIQVAIADRIHGAGTRAYWQDTFHAEPLVWGGYCNTAYPRQNRYGHLRELPTWGQIAFNLTSIKAGALPSGTPPDPLPPESDMIPRADFAARYAEINQFYADEVGLKRPGGMVNDKPPEGQPVSADVTAMTQWGYDLASGVSVNAVKNAIVRSEEWAAKHPHEAPPTYPT